MKLSASITSLSTWIPYLFGSSMSWTLPRHRPVHWWLVGFDVQGRFVSLNRPTMWLGKFDHDQSLFSRTLEMMVREMIPWIMAELFRLVKYHNLPIDCENNTSKVCCSSELPTSQEILKSTQKDAWHLRLLKTTMEQPCQRTLQSHFKPLRYT